MKQLIIIGAGGLAKEVYFLVKEINKMKKTWQFLGFADKEDFGKEIIDGYTVIGDDEFVLNEFKGIALAVAQGFTNSRKRIYEFYKKFGIFDFPNFIHPSVIGDFDSLKIGKGNIVLPCVVFCPDVEIGDANFINKCVVIGHDVKMSNCCVTNSCANISGNVLLGDCCLVGASSVIHQGVTLAAGSKLGLGSALTQDTVEQATYIGNPAKKIL